MHLTLPSSGRAPASRVPPLMSNVRFRRKCGKNMRSSVRAARTLGGSEPHLVPPEERERKSCDTSHVRNSPSEVSRISTFISRRNPCSIEAEHFSARNCEVSPRGHARSCRPERQVLSDPQCGSRPTPSESMNSRVCRPLFAALTAVCQVRSVWPKPNPSVERTAAGKPSSAAHLHR